jgi:hypothetical protein
MAVMITETTETTSAAVVKAIFMAKAMAIAARSAPASAIEITTVSAAVFERLVRAIASRALHLLVKK